MTWIFIAAAVAVLVFIGVGMLTAAVGDRQRGREVVDDLDERLDQAPDDPNAPGAR